MKKIIFLAAATLTLAACNNDENELTKGPVEAQITAGVNLPGTRAIDNQWEQDNIGVMATASTNVESEMTTLYKNVKYTTTATTNAAANFTAETGKGIFFQDATETVTFAAYGPYEETTSNATLPGADGVISGSTTQQATREAQKAFDYIYASGATASRSNPIVQFKDGNAFSHKMTRLIIIVKTDADAGFTTNQVTSGTYSLTGLNHSGTFNVTTGVAAATGTASADAWSLTDYSLKTEGETEQVTFTSILYPQNLGSALTFTAVIDGQTYVNSQDINPALDASTSYTYTITVKKTGLVISGCTIEPWGDGGNGEGDAEMPKQ